MVESSDRPTDRVEGVFKVKGWDTQVGLEPVAGSPTTGYGSKGAQHILMSVRVLSLLGCMYSLTCQSEWPPSSW